MSDNSASILARGMHYAHYDPTSNRSFSPCGGGGQCCPVAALLTCTFGLRCVLSPRIVPGAGDARLLQLLFAEHNPRHPTAMVWCLKFEVRDDSVSWPTIMQRLKTSTVPWSCKHLEVTLEHETAHVTGGGGGGGGVGGVSAGRSRRLAAAAAAAPRLTAVQVAWDLQQAMPALPWLESLSLRGGQLSVNIAHAIARAAKSLKVLHLRCQLNSEALDVVLKACGRLTVLQLGEHASGGGDGFPRVGDTCKHVSTMSFNGIHGALHIQEALDSLSYGLDSLSLRFLSRPLTDSSVAMIHSLPEPQRLSKLDVEAQGAPLFNIDIEGISSCTGLETLSLSTSMALTATSAFAPPGPNTPTNESINAQLRGRLPNLRSFTLIGFLVDSEPLDISPFLASCPQLSSVYFVVAALSTRALAFVSRCPLLTGLELERCNFFTAPPPPSQTTDSSNNNNNSNTMAGTTAIISSTLPLMSLLLFGCGDGNNAAEAAATVSLRKLSLDLSPRSNILRDVAAALTCMPHLEKLSLHNAIVEEPGWHLPLREHHHKLSSLSLIRCKLSDLSNNGLLDVSLASLPRLERLKLVRLTVLSKATEDAQKQKQQQEETSAASTTSGGGGGGGGSLKLSPPPASLAAGIDDLLLPQKQEDPAAAAAYRLSKLVKRPFPALRSLHALFASVPWLTDVVVCASPTLQDIELRNITGLDEIALSAAVSTGLRELHSFVASSCDLVAIPPFGRSHKWLRVLILSSQPYLRASDGTLAALCHCPRLETIDFSNTDLDSVAAGFANADEVTTPCCSIKTVIMSRSKLKSADGLEKLPQLRTLELVSCNQLEDLRALSRSTSLVSLDLRNCLNLPEVLVGLEATATTTRRSLVNVKLSTVVPGKEAQWAMVMERWKAVGAESALDVPGKGHSFSMI